MRVYAWCQWGAILSTGVLVTPMELQINYVCDECEGGIVVKTVTDSEGYTRYRAECADCGGTELISKWLLERQQVDWVRITMHLPPHLRALVDDHWKRPDAPKMDYQEAVASLYGEQE